MKKLQWFGLYVITAILSVGCSKDEASHIQLSDEELRQVVSTVAMAHGNAGVKAHLKLLGSKEDICVNKRGIIPIDDATPDFTVIERSEFTFEGTCPENAVGTAFRLETDGVSKGIGWMLVSNGAIYKGSSQQVFALGGHQLIFDVNGWKIEEGSMPAQIPVTKNLNNNFQYMYKASINAEKNGYKVHYPATITLNGTQIVKIVVGEESYNIDATKGE